MKLADFQRQLSEEERTEIERVQNAIRQRDRDAREGKLHVKDEPTPQQRQ